MYFLIHTLGNAPARMYTQIFKAGGGTEDVEKMKALIEQSKRERKEKLRTVDYNAKYDKYKELK